MAKMTLKEQVYNQIFDDIAQGKYQANDILTESKLMEKYQVSKSPVREALIELCKDEVIHSLPRLGYQVVLITLKEVLDILEYRTDIEISGLRRGFAAKMCIRDRAQVSGHPVQPGQGSRGILWEALVKGSGLSDLRKPHNRQVTVIGFWHMIDRPSNCLFHFCNPPAIAFLDLRDTIQPLAVSGKCIIMHNNNYGNQLSCR